MPMSSVRPSAICNAMQSLPLCLPDAQRDPPHGSVEGVPVVCGRSQLCLQGLALVFQLPEGLRVGSSLLRGLNSLHLGLGLVDRLFSRICHRSSHCRVHCLQVMSAVGFCRPSPHQQWLSLARHALLSCGWTPPWALVVPYDKHEVRQEPVFAQGCMLLLPQM